MRAIKEFGKETDRLAFDIELVDPEMELLERLFSE
jgi:hypothetical protein